MKKQRNFAHPVTRTCRTAAVVLAVAQVFYGIPVTANAQEASSTIATATPIKHVIVIIGENRTFDHIFATYKPKAGQTVDNLLSKQIVNEDGSPGPNFSFGVQYSAVDTHSDKYQVSPMDKTVYGTLPAPLVGGPTTPYFKHLDVAKEAAGCYWEQ